VVLSPGGPPATAELEIRPVPGYSRLVALDGLHKGKDCLMTPQVKTIDLTVTRLMAARPADVFDVWLDPKNPGRPWFGVTRAIVDPVLDGLFYHLVHFEGCDWPRYGRFMALDRPRLIQHTWMSEATRGLETVVTLNFEAQGDQTLVKLLPAAEFLKRDSIDARTLLAQ
jgi:uncharacterized protein YndB with AHSA1/START domain